MQDSNSKPRKKGAGVAASFLKLRQDAGALWILALVFLAGALNAAGLLRFAQTMSHMTGNLTKLGLSMAGAASQGGLLTLILVCFFIGATLSGYGFPKHELGQWRRSGLVLSLGGLLLLLSEWLGLPDALRMAALALVLGLQNGLALRYRGILTRTTHVTGHVTDCGAALGRMIHQRSFRGENLKLFLFHFLCLVSFLLGVIVLSALTGAPTSPPAYAIEGVALGYLLMGLSTLLYSLVRFYKNKG